MLSSQLKLTKQRKVILEELRKLKTHPSADEIYNIVRERLPRISLGTVYRNLEILSDAGVILKLDVAGSQKRFDGDTSKHYHLRCTKCGCIRDLNLEFDLSAIEEKTQPIKNISGFHLEFYGLCESCQEKI